ncbi:hypothetical protein M3Y97_00039100 [Aphelenchoides bicaudatus]|nr:hypothetical protein M3Y97_00039100 [Aphelenchoides bicaudatus]
MGSIRLENLLLFLSIFSIHEVMARRRKCPEGSWSEGRIVTELMSNYTKMLPDTEGSVHVNVELHVQDMGSLNEISADFQIDILFTQYWHDPTLSFTNHSQCIRNITMEPRFLSKIWTPNTCIINSKAAVIHSSPTENVMFILYDNGTVWTNHRQINTKRQSSLCTGLTYVHFHLILNRCIVAILGLHWMEDPVTMMKVIQLPDFDMVQFDTKREISLYPNGFWDQLQVVFTFKRRYGFYILQAYVPTYLTIIVSWVSFCMEPKALPARTTVGVSSLLAITMMFGNILKNLPRVSYVKAMDVWMLGCISFVFGTMVELAFVCYITRCQAGQKRSEYGINSVPNHSNSMSSSQSSIGGTYNNSIAFGCMGSRDAGVPGQTIGSLRYRHHPLANGVCGSGRGVAATESARGSLLCHERKNTTGSNRRTSQSQSFHGGNGSISGNYRQQHQSSPSPPPNSRLLRNGSPPTNGSAYEMNSMLAQPTPLTFEQVNGHQPQPVYMRALARRRNLLAIQPESIDKMSIVCFPLAFTFFNLIYWWYYLSQSFEGLPVPQQHHG